MAQRVADPKHLDLAGPPTGEQAPPGARQRRHDIDWLRTLALLGVFLFHAARPFNSDPWHVKDEHVSVGLELLTILLDQVQMPLLFLLAGASAALALAFRSGRQSVGERLVRLLGTPKQLAIPACRGSGHDFDKPLL